MDKAGNKLTDPRISAPLLRFDYMDPKAEAVTKAGGKGLQVMVILAFVAQLMLNITLSNTMQ